MTRTYARPPIAEAVIEFRYAGSGGDHEVAQARTRLAKKYPKTEELREVQISLQGIAGASVTPVGFTHYKMTSADGTNIVQIDREKVALSQLAPYPGWDSFVAEMKSVLRSASPLVRKRPLLRVGVRFINRLDIPYSESGEIDYQDYIAFDLVKPPVDHGLIVEMSGRVATVLEGDRFGLVMSFGQGPSPLIGNSSMVLDVEVYNQAILPVTPVDLWSHLEEIRVWKNRVFENSITDKARELFK